MKNKRDQPDLSLNIVLTLVIFVVWLLATDFLEYLLTERWYIYNHIPNRYKSLLLLGMMFASLIWLRKRISPKMRAVVLILVSIGIVVHVKYANSYEQLLRVPNISNVNKDWSIQGSRVTIIGKDFGATHLPGRVLVGGEDFRIISWDNYKVVAEQPVLNAFKKDWMVLCTSENVCKKLMKFEIRDPSTL